MTNVAESDIEEDEKAKSGVRETITTVLWALGIAFVLRTFFFQPFHIPTGSMEPGLLPGDYIITSKYSVGYGKHAAAPLPFPIKKGRLFEREIKRGDVIVFRPEGLSKTYIKRVIGLPGDEIRMKYGRLHINGEEVPAEHNGTGLDSNGNTAKILIESLSDGRTYEVYDLGDRGDDYDNTKTQFVREGHYFFMGDHRDNSKDSRFETNADGAGFVPKENIIGRAEIVLLSVDEDFALIKPWTWLNIRKDRWFKDIK